MADRLIEAAQSRWRAVNAPHLVALMGAGARLHNGKPVARPDEEEGCGPSLSTATRKLVCATREWEPLPIRLPVRLRDTE